MNPINPSYQQCMDFLSYLRVRVDAENGDLNILALQGIAPIDSKLNNLTGKTLLLNANEENVYNDTILLVYRSEDGSVKDVQSLLGTVDPGSYYKDHPGGQAHLTFGQHFYVKGTHMGYPALRAQNEVNRVWRDVDKNFYPSQGDYVSVGHFGVNIHAGGSTKWVNNWSAGCMNIWGGWNGTPYLNMLDLADKHLRRKGAVGVTIWSGRDFCRFADEGWSMKPTLMFGMFNPWVGELQNALKVKGYFSGTVDSDWQGKTETAVRAFQKDNGLKVDGLVGSATWAKLLG